MEFEPGLAIIEAPMGEGKTEAGIYLASQWMARAGLTGLYIGLPTAATSNQMHGRVVDFLSKHDADATVRLVHGMAWLLDEQSPDKPPEIYGTTSNDASEWFRPTRRSLLAPFGVGTVDQALLASLHVRFGLLRLFGLSRSVLIIDEVHAYDAYMTTILDSLLRWCAALGIPVILLSATLPAIRREQLHCIIPRG